LKENSRSAGISARRRSSEAQERRKPRLPLKFKDNRGVRLFLLRSNAQAGRDARAPIRFMKKPVILSFAALLFAACGDANQPTVNTNIATQNSSNSMTVSSHSQNSAALNSGQTDSKAVSNNAPKGKWTQSGDPIDTSAFDAEIKEAEKNLKANPNDEKLKKALADAFSKRGLALTEARQYASALGDFRRALKLDPNNAEAKKWIDQIISIYRSINKEHPKEGEEPPPLPFKKQ
jgi:tetratricopeptide (TPR) repeat protein